MTRVGDEPLTVVIDGVAKQRILRVARCLRCQFVCYTRQARARASQHATGNPGHRVVLVVTVTSVHETPRQSRGDLAAEPEPMSGFEAEQFDREAVTAVAQ